MSTRQFPMHEGANPAPSCEVVAGIDPVGPEPAVVHWCKTHNKQIPWWTNTCWDYNPMQEPFCVKVRALVEVLDK